MNIFKFFGVILLVMIVITVMPNIPALSQGKSGIDDIKDTVLTKAKYNGGFNDNTLVLVDKMLKDRNMNPSKIRIKYIPGINVVVQKQQKVYVQIEYDVKLKSAIGEGDNYRTVKSEGSTFCNKYFK